jgi:hypothetical protein
MTPSGSDVRGAKAMDQSNGEIAEGGQNLWSMARAQAGAVFAEGHIAHIMGAVFDVSIAAKKSPKVPLQKSPGVGNFQLALSSASRKFPRTSVL